MKINQLIQIEVILVYQFFDCELAYDGGCGGKARV